MPRGRATALTLALLLSGCRSVPEARAPNPLEAAPVDTTRVRNAAEAAAWPHRTALAADLDGDGRGESVVLAADVTLGDDGTPLWEDGHRWAVYVEAPAGGTLLYAAFVPQGHVEAAVTLESSDGRRNVHVDERTPSQARGLVIAYDGPGRARLVSAAHVQVERWFPDLTAPSPAAPAPSASPPAPRGSAASRP